MQEGTIKSRIFRAREALAAALTEAGYDLPGERNPVSGDGVTPQGTTGERQRMMIRGDQHVDDWAEVAVDYLDGRLDPETRLAVESHLAGCPDCAARLRRQQSVVRFLQETALDDPPEDLEYRAIGEMVFPSPGGQPLARPGAVQKLARTPAVVSRAPGLDTGHRRGRRSPRGRDRVRHRPLRIRAPRLATDSDRSAGT